MRVSMKECQEAYLLWKRENGEVQDIPRSTVVVLPNGKEVPLGNKIHIMKCIYNAMSQGKHYGHYKDLTKDEIFWWKEQGLDLGERQKQHHTEEEYHEAYLLWKEQNPDKQNVPHTTKVLLPNQKLINLGEKISRMKSIYHAMEQETSYGRCKDLTEEEILWWKEQGLDLGERQKQHHTEEEYHEAYLLWKLENQQMTEVPRNAVIVLSSGKEVPLGQRVSTMQLIYNAMKEGKHFANYKDLTKEQIGWWMEQGLDFNKNIRIKCTEEEYREAYLLWKEQNPEAECVPYATVVKLPNGMSASLGKRISSMRLIYRAMQEGTHYGNYKDLTEEQIAWWRDQGVDVDSRERKVVTEEEYREAYLLWKKENPKEENVPQSTIVTLPNGKNIGLGVRIALMKQVLKAMQEGTHYGKNNDLTEEQIAWWTEQGVDLSRRRKMSYTEQEYREAYLLWKEQNPNLTDVPQSTQIILPNGKRIPLGTKINRIRTIYRAMQQGKHYGNYKDLTKEQISWWKDQGLDLGKVQKNICTEEEYQKAYQLWKKENPETKDVPYNLIVELPNRKKVSLGKRISLMKQILKAMQEGSHYLKNDDLTEEQIDWWTEQGVLCPRKVKNDIYQEAYLLWKKENPKEKKIPYTLIVELANGQKVSLGKRISNMRSIYAAMQRGEHYNKCKNLTEEEILWWTEQGISLESRRYEYCNEEEYREAYLLWKKKYPNINQIPYNCIIEISNGRKIALGRKVSIMKSIYSAMKRGKHYGSNKDLTKEQIDWWKENGLCFEQTRSRRKRRNIQTINSLLTEFDIDLEEFMKSLELASNQTIEKTLPVNAENLPLNEFCKQAGYNNKIVSKAIEIHESLKEETLEQLISRALLETQNQKETSSLSRVLKEFDIDFNEFIRSLEPTKNKITEKPLPENAEELSLNKLCKQVGYHYKIVSKAIKLHAFLKEETLEQLIQRVLLENQNKEEIPSWIFKVYGPMVEQILLYLKLDSKRILKHISTDIISLEEAMCQEVFQSTCKRNECDYLDDIYKKILERIDFQASEEINANRIVDFIYKTGKRNQLLKDEIDVLIESFKKYIQTIREYQIIDVGLTAKEEEKFEKIEKYNLTEEEIEESYFVPFHFEEGILLGEKSDLYKRRELLRQYIIDWDYYTEEEKQEVKEEQHFTEEEFLVLEETRREINQAIEKVKSK